MDPVEAQIRRVVRGPRLPPEGLAHLEGLVEHAAAAAEVEAGRLVLLALPADADAEIEPAARQHVERRRRLGQHHRSSQRRDQDVRAEPDARRHAGQHRQRGHGFEPVAVGAGGLDAALGAAHLGPPVGLEVLAEHHVVRDEEPVDPGPVEQAGPLEQRLPAAGILGPERPHADRELRFGHDREPPTGDPAPVSVQTSDRPACSFEQSERPGAMRILMIGGTGPSGVPIVRRLVDHGHDVTILHRGTHERPETPADLVHLHADPYDEASLTRRTGRLDVGHDRGHVRAPAHRRAGDQGPLRPLRLGGGRARLPRDGRTRGCTTHPGCPCRCREDARLVDDPAEDDKGYRIVRTEQAVFEAHPQAAHFRYPYLYGPYQPAPREWSVVRRILDGRRRIIVADDGLTLHHHCFTENVAAAVATAIEHPERSAGTIFNVGDEEVLTVRQVVELCRGRAGRRARDRLDALRPGRPRLAAAGPAAADPPRARPQPPAPPARPPRRRSGAPGRTAARRGGWPSTGPSAVASRRRCSPTPSTTQPRTRSIESWSAARASVTVPTFEVPPRWGLAYSGPQGRPRMHTEFVE